MSLRSWWNNREREKIRRYVLDHDPFVDPDSMRLAFTPLSETAITLDDLSVCIGCGYLFLTSMEAKHVAMHDWMHQTNPITMLSPFPFHRPEAS